MLLLATLTLAGGCASSGTLGTGPRTPLINRANSPVWRGGQGSAAVLQTSGVERELPGYLLADLPEAYRRDNELFGSRPGPMMATSEWPEPAPPSLSERRYLHLPSDASTQLYFEPEGSGGGWYRWDGGWYWRGR